MVHIVLLADRERLIELFTRSETLPGAPVRVADGIGDALTGISGRGPFLFFIQQRLGELSGELIASRLADELRGRSVRFFLLGDPASVGDIFHGGIDESLPDDELAEAIRALVFAPLPETRKRRGTRKKKAADALPVTDVPVPETLLAPVQASPLPTEDIDDIVEIGQPAATGDRSPVRRPAFPEGTDPGAVPRFQDFLESALEESADPETRGDESRGPEAAPRTEFQDGALPAHRLAPPGPAGTPRRGLPRPGLLFLLLGGLAAGGLFLSLTLCSTKKPPAMESTAEKTESTLPKETPPSSPQRSPRTIPSFVPRQSADAGYGKANPGWELYRSAGADFRIYREKGFILAIQAIDRSGAGLNPALLSTALTEISGSRNYLVETQERKGSYRIERGRLKNGAAILIYLKEPERKVRAFVFDFR